MVDRRAAVPRIAIAARPCLAQLSSSAPAGTPPTWAGRAGAVAGSGPDNVRRDLLTEAERARLAPIAALMRIERGAILFRQGDPATAIYDIADGVLKSTVPRADGTRAILGFYFPQDIVGLDEAGLYANTVQAVTSATLYRLRLPELQRLLRRDSELDHQFLIKACHDLRVAQLHLLNLGVGRADARLAGFLDLMRRIQPGDAAATLIELPMSRADIADYLGLTPETVSRAFTRLRRARILACPGPHLVRILDADRFRAMTEQDAIPGPGISEARRRPSAAR